MYGKTDDATRKKIVENRPSSCYGARRSECVDELAGVICVVRTRVLNAYTIILQLSNVFREAAYEFVRDESDTAVNSRKNRTGIPTGARGPTAVTSTPAKIFKQTLKKKKLNSL